MRKTVFFLSVVLAALALVPSWASADLMITTTGSVTLAYLLQPDTAIQSGDKLFYDFSDYSPTASGGATPVDPATVSVTPVQVGGEWGLDYQSAAFVALAGQMQDTQFHYRVQVTNPNMLISDNTLEVTGAALGTGYAFIIEDVTPLDSSLVLAQNMVYFSHSIPNNYSGSAKVPSGTTTMRLMGSTLPRVRCAAS